MEVKRICQWCGKPFMAKKTTTNYCSPQCSKRGYKHRMKERRMELREIQEMLELKRKLVNLNSNFQQSYDNIFHLKLSATMLQLELLCIKSYP